MFGYAVVLYLHSTSNHNVNICLCDKSKVVLYLHSTSNHNSMAIGKAKYELYYIFILHQTTSSEQRSFGAGALYYIFILHQTTT